MAWFMVVVILCESSLVASNFGDCIEGARCGDLPGMRSHDSLFHLCSVPIESFRCKLSFDIARGNRFHYCRSI
jgi:hypothetical protein